MKPPAEATIVAFEVMICHNSLTDHARSKSMKTSSDSEDSNRSDEFKKGTFAFEICEKNTIFWFSGSVVFATFQKVQNIPFPFPCEHFPNIFWLGLRLKNPTNNKFQPKWVTTVLRLKHFGWKKWAGSHDFRMTSSWLEKTTRARSFHLLWTRLGENLNLWSLDWLCGVSGSKTVA